MLAPKGLMQLQPQNQCEATWRSNEKERHGKLFTLCLLPKQTGFSYSSQGRQRYATACKAAGMHPVGCGTSTYPCADRTPGCVEMPPSWNCEVTGKLAQKTGWDNFLTFYTEGKDNNYLYGRFQGHNKQPNVQMSLHPLCANWR
eukprot:COSAG01_NODE_4690_length_4808_cov_46.552771_5_plen_144_part_00